MQVTYRQGFHPLAIVADDTPLVALNPLTGELVSPFTDPAEVREWIVRLGNVLETLPGEKRELEVKHTFMGGVYMRELFIPKGTLLVGKMHRLDCINIVSKGDISVLTESGSARIKAGFSIVSPANIQKVGYAHEDTVFVNIFRTEETDAEKIEQVIAWDKGVLLCQ